MFEVCNLCSTATVLLGPQTGIWGKFRAIDPNIQQFNGGLIDSTSKIKICLRSP